MDRERARRGGLGHADRGERGGQQTHDASHVLIGQDGAEKLRAAGNVGLHGRDGGKKRLDALRVVAGVDEDGRIRAQQLEAAGRGTGHQRLEEGVLGKGAAALTSIPSNLAQGTVGVVLFTVAYVVITRIPALKKGVVL